MLGVYLSTLAHAMLNVKTLTLGFRRFNKTNKLLNRPCPHESLDELGRFLGGVHLLEEVLRGGNANN